MKMLLLRSGSAGSSMPLPFASVDLVPRSSAPFACCCPLLLFQFLPLLSLPLSPSRRPWGSSQALSPQPQQSVLLIAQLARDPFDRTIKNHRPLSRPLASCLTTANLPRADQQEPRIVNRPFSMTQDAPVPVPLSPSPSSLALP